jgi:hypothetical protein
MNKIYYFIIDYNTKHGVVKKGESLTGRLSKASKEPKVFFDFFEKSDPAKAEAGEGIFSIVESDLKNFATDVAPTTPDTEKKDDTNKKVVDDKKATTGFKSWSTTKKAIVVGSGLAVLGLAVWYFVIRKK